MHLEIAQYALGALSGGLVGLSLGLFGGGGSILAVPLMVYLVGVPSAHVALGTSALAVAANAAANLVTHARMGNVRWRCAAIYSAAGIAGAFFGSSLGKLVDGERLLFLFALVMIGGALVSVALAAAVRGLGGLLGWHEANANALALFTVPLGWAALCTVLLMQTRRRSQLLTLVSCALLALLLGALS